MFKQPIFSLTLSFALLTGAVFTAVGQTTTPTRSGSSTMSSPGSQTRNSGMSASPSSGMAPASGSMTPTSSQSGMSGMSSMGSQTGTSGMSSTGSSGMSSTGSQTGMSGMSSQTGTSGMSSASGSMSSASGSSMSTSTGKDLAASAGLSANHSTLLKALQAAGLADQAKGAGPFTVFAPTNDAFSKLPAGTLEGLLKPSAKKQLTNILTTHVVSGSFKAADLTDGQTIKTVNGETLTVSKQGGSVMIKDAKGGSATVTTPDIQATNGIVHSIDTVLMPSK